jgi:translation initiation factor 1
MAPNDNYNNSRLVYSTDGGKVSKNREPQRTEVPKDGIVRISRETKGRKGKGMTLITGIPMDRDGLKDLAKELKQKCGTGGTVKGDVIEIQGDHRDKLVGELTSRGWTVKKAGG